MFFKAKLWDELTLFRRRISAHLVAFLVNQAVNSHYFHYVFISFVTTQLDILSKSLLVSN